MTADEYSSDLAARKRVANVCARGESYRFTRADEIAVLAARDEMVRRIASDHTSRRFVWHESYRETFRRVMAHAIGCALIDLRDSEIAWIDERVGEIAVPA